MTNTNKLSPQVQTLLTHLQKHGSISSAEADTVYKMRSLPRRICDLKDAGYAISRELKKDPTGQRYARYTLVGSPAHEAKLVAEPQQTLPLATEVVPPVLRVGATIRVTDPVAMEEYESGDQGTVVEVDSDGAVYATFDTIEGRHFLLSFEFEVIA
ncbi:hypothetical protein A7981_05565 [Methylovorus sp. MM2]|uniref:helix-turn-helix domain-containing protein n=1 Tax=Methylovorus sp. MM2 TaxID=1848038 RepID=UPI0007DFF376|nr:helix-turn-helix domain-containing protein [Methylovorus sp. MM2]OAM52906.1 hypothetical protein A7981_05565 [Methylovorus sp. MM2]